MKNTGSGTQVPRFSEAVEALRRCLRIDAERLSTFYETAAINGSDLLIELRNAEKTGKYSITDRAVAKISNLEYLALIDPQKLRFPHETHLRDVPSRRVVSYEIRKGEFVILLAPHELDISRLYALRNLARSRQQQLLIVNPKVLKSALEIVSSQSRVKAATHELNDNMPDLSAFRTATGSQGVVVGITLTCLALASVFYPIPTMHWIHIAASFFFFTCVFLRFLAIPIAIKKGQKIPRAAPPPRGIKYAVLVAVYKESTVIRQLVCCLRALDWPSGFLEIILICEEDDTETLEAIKKLRLPEHFTVLRVPQNEPRTKPKALNYGLMTVVADYVVVYDAEDRPHPAQLREAYTAFALRSKKLACLQAPLRIVNGEDSFISRVFAFEYAALFQGLLPALNYFGCFLPLGGTSNHFKYDALINIGGWDPYNTTEDADLGLRLYRNGYQIGLIELPTYEVAPITFQIWLKQRTRWLKGWVQTWMVLMRSPITSCSQIGIKSFVVAQILFVGLILSAMLHMVILIIYGISLGLFVFSIKYDFLYNEAFIVDLINFSLAYFSFFTLGFVVCVMDKIEVKYMKVAIALPVYWGMMTIAAWRAIFQLVKEPHKWEKTPHSPVDHWFK